MHAMIRRYDGVAGSTEELMRLGRQQASAMSTIPGLVSYALLEVGEGAPMSVSVFETQRAMRAAERIARSTAGGQLHSRSPHPPRVASGEVIVQKGM